MYIFLKKIEERKIIIIVSFESRYLSLYSLDLPAKLTSL